MEKLTPNLPPDFAKGLITWDGDRKQILLQFTTSRRGGEAGFDFVVSPETKCLRIDLTLNGAYHPQFLYLGRKGANPPSGPFLLPVLYPDKLGLLGD